MTRIYIRSTFSVMFGKQKGTQVPLVSACILNPKKSEISSSDRSMQVSFIPMASVSEKGEVDLTQEKELGKVWNGYTYFHENDVVFAKITPCMENGKGAIMRNLKNRIGFGTTEFHVLRPIKGVSNSEWLYHLTMQPIFRIKAEQNMTGSAGQKRVPTDYLEKYKVIIPPMELQTKFAQIVKRTEILKKQYQASLLDLENLYASLCQQALNGMLHETAKTSVDDSTKTNIVPIERKTLAGWIIQMFNDNPKFGVTMFQKNLHICEYYSEVEYDTNYSQNRAGPDDRQFMKDFLEEMVEKKWYRQEQKFKLIRFIPDENAGKLVKKYGEYFKSKARKISFVLKLLKDKSLDDVELISTLYAVWNNRIIRKEEITPEVLANDVFSWSEEKNKYTRAEIKLMYEWMNDNRLVPVGFGKEIRRIV